MYTQNNDKIDSHLIESIACLLEAAVEPLSEYRLIQHLNEQDWDLSISATDTLALYTSHFVVYNSLYILQEQYWRQHQRFLQISALAIQLHLPVSTENLSTEVAGYAADTSLREYYLDWSNLDNATEDSVKQLLNQFWERFVTDDESTKAFNVFSLKPTVSYKEVKQRYRSLAMKYHPDRGGDSAEFQQLNWAFGVLQRIYQFGN